MPPSLGAILRTFPRLQLVLHGTDKLDTPVALGGGQRTHRPTPYLDGGELLLTTGMRWTHEMVDARAYASPTPRELTAGSRA